MRLKNFRRLVDDSHLKLVNVYGHEIFYESDFTGKCHRLDRCTVYKIRPLEERVLEVTIVNERYGYVNKKIYQDERSNLL